MSEPLALKLWRDLAEVARSQLLLAYRPELDNPSSTRDLDRKFAPKRAWAESRRVLLEEVDLRSARGRRARVKADLATLREEAWSPRGGLEAP